MKRKTEYIGINLVPELKDFLLKKAQKEFKTITEVITDFIVQNYKNENTPSEHSLTAI